MKKVLLLAVGTAMLLAATTVSAYDNLTPADANGYVVNNGAYILDVRTEAEFIWVGHPNVTPNNVVNVPWQKENKGSLILNPTFLSDVEEFFGANKDAHIITMCRSGVRSVAAALALESAGYTNVSNMLKGYEGDKNSSGYRVINGWKNTLGLKGHDATYSDPSVYPD